MGVNKRVAATVSPHHAFRQLNETFAAHLDPLGMAVPLVHARLAWASRSRARSAGRRPSPPRQIQPAPTRRAYVLEQ